jgi:putative acetyltransferase
MTEINLNKVSSPEQVSEARLLFREYVREIGESLEYQGFSEEQSTLPEPYTPPDGIIFLARVNGNLAGCIALRSINRQNGELKRLYVRSNYRGIGVGKQLVEALIQTAREAGYNNLYLDTLPSMLRAQKLYNKLGFETIEPYHSNYLPGTSFYVLDLLSD